MVPPEEEEVVEDEVVQTLKIVITHEIGEEVEEGMKEL